MTRKLVNIGRVSRLITIGMMLLMITIIGSAGFGWMLHHEIMATYTENYETLMEAGIVDAIQSPKGFSDRILLIVTAFPLATAALVCPCLLFAAKEVYGLAKDS